jgi:gluconate 2-dehydrogenase gamma chain
MSLEFDRRAFLAAGTAFGAALLAADSRAVEASFAHMHAARRSPQGVPLEVLTPEQAADIEAVAALIVPTDDLPGAREARVLHFIDHSLATWNSEQRDPLLAGLADFNRQVQARFPEVQRFAQLAPEQQIQFVRAGVRGRFFLDMRFATVVGMFGNPSYGGNHDKAGWRVLGYDDRYVWQPPFGWYDDPANWGGGGPS